MAFQRSLFWFCVLAFSVCSVRTEAAGIPLGSSELRLSAAFDHLDINTDGGDDVATLDEAQIAFGYFHAISGQVQVGGSLGLLYQAIDIEGGGSASQAAMRWTGDVIVNFSASQSVIPFAQLSFGLIHWSDDDDTDYDLTLILPMIGVGMRVPVGESAAVVALLGFENQLSAQGSDDLQAFDFGLHLGISAFPGGLR